MSIIVVCNTTVSHYDALDLPTNTRMGIFPDTQNCGLPMQRECQERFPRHRPQRKPLVRDPGIHHGTCVTHVPWCISGSLTHGGGENIPGIPGACITRIFYASDKKPITCSQHGRLCYILYLCNRWILFHVALLYYIGLLFKATWLKHHSHDVLQYWDDPTTRCAEQQFWQKYHDFIK